jgi:hypothetical protein
MAGPHPPSGPWKVERPIHVAKTDAATFAVALDPSGKLHFQGAKLSGDHIIALVGRDTPDSHLAELAADEGFVRLQFKSADVLDHGVVQLAYAVLPPDA